MLEADKTAVRTKIARLKAKFVLSWCLDKVLVRFPDAEINTGLPVLMVINHPGWLDIELSLFLVEELLGLDYYMMANMNILEKRPFMRKHGVFGVDEKDPFAIGRAMKYTASLLHEHPDRCVVVFPQGDMIRSIERPIEIKQGTAQIARLIKNVTILPVALHYDHFRNKLPEAFVRIGEPINFRGNIPPTRILTETIQQRMEQELDMLQRDAYALKVNDNAEGYDIVLNYFTKQLFRT